VCCTADPFLCLYRLYILARPGSDTGSDYTVSCDRININPDQKLRLQPGYAYDQDWYNRYLEKPGQRTSPDRF
jgi:hypothetical protein